MAKTPDGIDLDKTVIFPEPAIAFCSRHLEPFKTEWPRGFGILCVTMLKHVLAHPRFEAQFPPNPATGKSDLEPRRASHVLRTLSPLCCLLGNEMMASLTEQSLEQH